MTHKPQKRFMLEAIKQAKIAKARGDYAIGAVIIKGTDILIRQPNTVKQMKNSILHSEIEALKKAVNQYGDPYLKDFVLYSTHEPCPMCAGATIMARIGAIVYGCLSQDMIDYKKKSANERFKWRGIAIPCKEIITRSGEDIKVYGGFMREECKKLFHN